MTCCKIVLSSLRVQSSGLFIKYAVNTQATEDDVAQFLKRSCQLWGNVHACSFEEKFAVNFAAVVYGLAMGTEPWAR